MKTRCWQCGKEHDQRRAMEIHDGPPENGDFSFCFDCGAFAIFDDSFVDAIRKPTPQENFEIKTNRDFIKVYVAWAMQVKSRSKH